jgi:hypothetical protein
MARVPPIGGADAAEERLFNVLLLASWSGWKFGSKCTGPNALPARHSDADATACSMGFNSAFASLGAIRVVAYKIFLELVFQGPDAFNHGSWGRIEPGNRPIVAPEYSFPKLLVGVPEGGVEFVNAPANR